MIKARESGVGVQRQSWPPGATSVAGGCAMNSGRERLDYMLQELTRGGMAMGRVRERW